MSDITSVTEGRVTVTANDTEENIRAAAGFADADADKAEKADDKPADEVSSKPAADVGDRNPDGTFKAKAETPADGAAKPAAEGDPRKSIQAKINQAIAKQREAERRAEEAERRLQEREAQVTQPPQVQAPPQPPTAAQPTYLQLVQRYQSDPDAPKFDDYVAAGLEDPYTVYQAAMAAFIGDKRHAEREEARAQQTEQQERQSHLASALNIAAETHPDFPALLQAADQVSYPKAVTDQLLVEARLDPSLSAELFHHLLTHPDDAAHLATMAHPIAAAREIGRLTARLSAPSGPDPVFAQTTAKPLIKPVRPSVMAPESSPDELPFGSQYVARMNEQERKARLARRA